MTGRLLASSWRLEGGIPSSEIWAAAGLMVVVVVPAGLFLVAAKAGWVEVVKMVVERRNARVAVVVAAWNGLRICFVGVVVVVDEGGEDSFGFVCILWTVFGLLDGTVVVEKAAAIDRIARNW